MAHPLVNSPASDRWTLLSALFDEAIELTPDEREAYIADKCGDDAELEQRLRRMLAADAGAESGDFLGAPALSMDIWDRDVDQTHYEPGSRRFGAYRLIRLIGAGGMGEVHLAERSDGQFEQRVALKLLPHPTPGLMRRFRQERQILARLEHPNIARLLDGGVGEANVPYFAMEYIEGVTIVDFGQQRKLGIPAILRLFLQVCEAVQYAHRNLVIHRDIKPNNVLVAADGAPKLLDFGIAKVLQDTDDDKTRTNARAFTLDYAAPEQIRGEAVTTATDVYALGIVLYELLTGARPYKFRRDVLPEQAILDTEAIAPSVAVMRGSVVDNARCRALRGDIDTIVLNAIAKEPERRYPTVEALANDIRRHLDGMPITARGESAWYRLRKFTRRNRIAVVAAMIVTFALVAATVVSQRQARIATEQAARAEEKSKTTEAVKDYLLSVFASANPYNTDGKIVTARDLLEGGLDQVDKKLAGQPQVQAEIYASFVETFLQLNQPVLGKRAGQLALDRYREFLPPDAIEILRLESELAQADFTQTQFDGLIDRFNDLLARLGDRGGEYNSVRADVLALLSMTQFRLGHFEQAVETDKAALVQMRKIHGEAYHYEVGIVLYNLFIVRLAEGRLDEAAALIDEFVPNDRKLVGPLHPGLVTDVYSIGRLLDAAGRLHEARELLDASLSARRKQFPETHQFIIITQGFLAWTEAQFGDAERCEKIYADLIARATAEGAAIGATDVVSLYFGRAQCLADLGRKDEAHRELASARAAITRITDSDSPIALTIAALDAHLDGALDRLKSIAALQHKREDRDEASSFFFIALSEVAAGNFLGAQDALASVSELLRKNGRSTSVLARKVEIEWAKLPPNVSSREATAAHWLRASEIGCVNFGCDDARVREWAQKANEYGAKPNTTAAARAAEKPYEAEYTLALDILATAKAAKPDPVP